MNNELAVGISKQTEQTRPLIQREDIVPINDRPLSPRDITTITIHGVPLDREAITPIEMETDTDDDVTDLTADGNLNNLIKISPSFPINVTVTYDITTTDNEIRTVCAYTTIPY